MKHLKLLSLIFVLVLFSCGRDGEEPDPVQPENKYPAELVGTWEFYSGNPVAILSSVEEDNILNHTFTFVANGNMSEAIVYADINKQGKTTSVNGNWYVEHKQIQFTDWQGNAISNNFSYKINADFSLTLTIGEKSAVYYKQDDIKMKYPSLIVGSWNNMRNDGGRRKMIFSSNGRGTSRSTYIEGIFYGSEDFSWSYNDNVITVDYDHITYPTGHHEYVINYLNKKSISWGSNDYAVHYVRE